MTLVREILVECWGWGNSWKRILVQGMDFLFYMVDPSLYLSAGGNSPGKYVLVKITLVAVQTTSIMHNDSNMVEVYILIT